MARRFVRAVMLAVLAATTLGMVKVSSAAADTVFGQCTVVANPTPTNHSMCSGDNLGTFGAGGLDLNYAALDHTTLGAGSNLSSGTFVDADLTDATWFHVALQSADFTGATLDGINLGSGLQTGAMFVGAHITAANLTNGAWGAASFAGADLTGSDFSGGRFGTGSSLTDFTGATLTGTSFQGTALVPSSVTATATSPAGANVSWPLPQSETGEQPGPCHDSSGPVASGDLFPVGATQVTCNVVSTANNTFGTGSFTVTVSGTAPAITSADRATFKVGAADSFTVTATGTPAPAVAESGGLPNGVTFANGVLAGTPAAGTGGTYPLTFTASNGISPDSTQSFTLTVTQAPGITSADATSFTVGTSGSFSVTADGYPSSSITESGGLPNGVTFANGVLAGTPAAGTGGRYPLTLTASNGVSPDARQSFTLTVTEAPAITSPRTTTFVEGQINTFTVTTTGFPATITVAGSLPAGVMATDNHDGTATISGNPSKTGSYPITIIDTNPLTTASQTFTLVVLTPLTINGTLPDGTVGVPYRAKLTATGGTHPYTWSIMRGTLPPGLHLAADGTVSGTPTRSGTYHVTVQLNDPASKAITVVIAAATPATSHPAVPHSPAARPGGGAGPLARTGTGAVGTIEAGIAALLLGVALVLISRARRSRGKHLASD